MSVNFLLKLLTNFVKPGSSSSIRSPARPDLPRHVSPAPGREPAGQSSRPSLHSSQTSRQPPQTQPDSHCPRREGGDNFRHQRLRPDRACGHASDQGLNTDIKNLSGSAKAVAFGLKYSAMSVQYRISLTS